MEYTTISLPDATYRCSEVLTEEALNYSLRTPLQNVIQNLNTIGNYIKNNEQNWINNSDEDPEEDPEGIHLNQPLIGINNINERPSENNSILFYNGSWDFKSLSNSLEKLLSIKGTPGNNQILQYYDNNWRYTDLPTLDINLSGLLGSLKNDTVNSSNKGQNKVLVYSDGTWSYKDYNSSQEGNVDLSNYTWWGQHISNNEVKGNLSGNIQTIEFYDSENDRTVYLGLDTDGNLKVSSSSGIVNFYATGGVSSLGSNSGSGGGVSPSGGASLDAVWNSLGSSTGNYSNRKIAIEHIPSLPYLPNTKDGATFQLPSKTSRVTPYTLVTTDDLSNVSFTLSPATQSSLGGIKVGEGLVVGNDGTLDVSQSWLNERYITNSQGSVTNDMLAGNIANSKLVNSSITIGSTTISLGGEVLVSDLINDLDDTFVTLTTPQNISGLKTFTTGLTTSNGISLNRSGEQWLNFSNGNVTKNFSLGQDSGGDCALYASGNVNFYTNIGGNVGIGTNVPQYKFDVNGNIHTNSAYYLDDRLFANNDTINNSGLNIGYGYAVGNQEKNQSQLPMALWGNGISFRAADGDTYGNCTKIDDTYGIMGKDFIGVTDKFRFEYDLSNNTVWVLKADGTAVNFASLGGVTSLGEGSSGTPNISSLNIDSLTAATFNATIIKPTSGEVVKVLPTEIVEGHPIVQLKLSENASKNAFQGGMSLYPDGDLQIEADANIYLEQDTTLDDMTLQGMDGEGTINWNITSDGTANFKKLKVGSLGSVIQSITWNTSTNRLEVKIGSNTYSFQPASIN